MLAILALAAWLPAGAEVAEVNLAKQYGVSTLPLVVMERARLIEKHAALAGIPDLKVNWVTAGGANVLNEGIISGRLHFIAVGSPPMLTLWDRTRQTVGVKGVAGMTVYPLYLNVRNAAVRKIEDFSAKDKIAVPAIKVSMQAIILQMAAAKHFGDAQFDRLDPLTVSLSHPDGQLALASGMAGVTAHFTVSPFSEQELKAPGVRTLLTSFDVLGGRSTASFLVSSTKFRNENPKVFQAVVAAFREAIETINADKRAAAALYLKHTKDTKTSVDEVHAMIGSPDWEYSLTPHKIMPIASFMHQRGSIRTLPSSWRDLFFPEVHALEGD